MKRNVTYQVKEVARIAGVSVRALHHYDDMGLLVPSARSPAGYRLYDEDDLLRLQQIAIGRELGLSLEEIRRSLDDPRFDRRQALLAHRDQLLERAKQTEKMIRAIDSAIAILDGEAKGATMNEEDLFDGFDPSKHDKEAEERWGDTEAYKQSMRRTKNYSKEDWTRIRDENAAIYRDLNAALQAGKMPTDDEVMDIADRARLAIDRWFYPCSVAMHAQLADLYEADTRFAENIDKHGEGLTAFLVAAIRANERRHGG